MSQSAPVRLKMAGAALTAALAVAVAAAPGLAVPSAAAAPSTVTVDDTQVFPESITSTASQVVIFGSASKPIIYRSAPGGDRAEPWIHLTGPGMLSTLGVLADARTGTLWACVIARNGVGLGAPAHTMLRAFDLRTGAQRADYALPGAANLCNDISIGPDRNVYATDTVNGRVLRLTRGAHQLAIWIDDPRLRGADGLTFLGGTLYVNTFTTNHIYRIPIGADGAAGAPVDIALSQPIDGPDGMRAAGGRLYLAENRAGRVDEVTIEGDRATVTVLKTGYQTPTAVSPVGGVLWVGEAKFGYMQNPKLRGQDPGPFRAYALPLPAG